MKFFYLSILILYAAFTSMAQSAIKIRPSDTDPAITANNDFHFVYKPNAPASLQKLFIFFPGTGGIPQFYQSVMERAATLGYHVIGLTYPNNEAINSFCAAVNDTTCHRRARLEVFDGTDRHPDINVNPTNSIKNRTEKILIYLKNTYPNDNWAQYFKNDSINWNKIALGGHSQGAGHAGIIGKIKQVDRVLQFAALDWVGPRNRSADWVSMPGLTPPNKYYAFIHQRDETIAFSLVNKSWVEYQTAAIAGTVNIDSSTSPFNGSHCLYTNITPAFDTSAWHGAVAVSIYVPKDASQKLVYLPVWDYMLTNQSNTSGVIEGNTGDASVIYPNPVQSYLSCTKINDITAIAIFDISGKQLVAAQGFPIDLSTLNTGTYFITINTKNGGVVHQKFIKVD